MSYDISPELYDLIKEGDYLSSQLKEDDESLVADSHLNHNEY